jgi:hypothetical protein
MKQKTQAVCMYKLMKTRSKNLICQKYGRAFWNEFKQLSDSRFKKLMDEFEEIGPSMFAFNYIYAPAYVSFYTAMENLELDPHERDVLMLEMNEKMLLSVPKILLHAIGKAYYRNMSRLAQKRMAHPPKQLHEFDWQITYRKESRDCFEIDIKRCGFIAYARKYGGVHMLPGICLVDYMISHYMHVGFARTGTLAQGASSCDCKYSLNGSCRWDIESALLEQK